MNRPTLYGLLNWFKPFLPDFPLRTAPLRQLLAKPHLPWTIEHTNCVRDTVSRILATVPRLNFDPSQTLCLETGIGPSGMIGVLLQKDPLHPRWLPIASHCRTWKPREAAESELALECICIQETLAKLQHFTAFASRLEVAASPSFRALVNLAPKGHPRIHAQILDIKAYRPTFTTKDNPRLPPELAWSVEEPWCSPPDTIPLPPELNLRTPARRSKYNQFHPGPYVHIQFDGGSLGTGEHNPGECGYGYVISDSTGVEIMRNGGYMGNGATNNECEAEALR
jgi:RNase H-like domain found in reverse transcriptase